MSDIVNACIIPDQLGLQPILERLAWLIKKSKQFDQSDIASLIAMLTVNGPLHNY